MSATYRGIRCPVCLWALYDGVRCQCPECERYGKRVRNGERMTTEEATTEIKRRATK